MFISCMHGDSICRAPCFDSYDTSYCFSDLHLVIDLISTVTSKIF